MRLVQDARQGWRWYSTWGLALLVALPLLWAQLPPEVLALIPPEWKPYIVALMAFLTLVGRFLRQGRDDDGG